MQGEVGRARPGGKGAASGTLRGRDIARSGTSYESRAPATWKAGAEQMRVTEAEASNKAEG